MYHEKEKMIGNEQDQKIKMLTGVHDFYLCSFPNWWE